MDKEAKRLEVKRLEGIFQCYFPDGEILMMRPRREAITIKVFLESMLLTEAWLRELSIDTGYTTIEVGLSVRDDENPKIAAEFYLRKDI